jgi:nitrate reductase NapD
MNITSAVVYATPLSRAQVKAGLVALSGVEIHAETEDGRFIITVEDVPGIRSGETVMRLHQLDGVQFAAMVYQYSDDDPRQQEDQS